MQLIYSRKITYSGETDRSIPNISFPDGSVSANPTLQNQCHRINQIIEGAISPCINLSPEASALLIMDVFHGQMTLEVMDLLNKKNILVTCASNKMTF